jgi:hypothetical protein
MMYVGIGSCPHALFLEEMTDEWDQILPVFIRNTKATILHYDPMFERHLEFMKLYFETKGFTHVDEYHWISHLHDVTLIPKNFDHPTDDHLLEELSEKAIHSNTKLVVQEFTGHDLTNTFKSVYKNTKDELSFKCNILFDITYGTNCNCMTNMTKYKPLYDDNGDFLNPLLASDDEIISYIGLSSEINDFIKIRFTRKYLDLVNQQVDYRRRLQGSTVLFTCDGYNDESSPDTIMAYLQERIRPVLTILDQLGLVTPQKWGMVHSLFESYKDYDVYKWNDAMRNIVSK